MSSPSDLGQAGRALEVFLAAGRLGLTSFGGPIAHIGYFRRELVERRRWVDEGQLAQLLALCQFLPGPASSQLGFSLGLLRAGWGGALAASAAFTLPSALLLFAFAVLLPRFSGAVGQGALHGLKLVALSLATFGLGINVGWYKACIEPFMRGPIAAFNVQSIDVFLIRLVTGPEELDNWFPLEPSIAHRVVRIASVAGLFVGAFWGDNSLIVF